MGTEAASWDTCEEDLDFLLLLLVGNVELAFRFVADISAINLNSQTMSTMYGCLASKLMFKLGGFHGVVKSSQSFA